jgi:hypothetical protein
MKCLAILAPLLFAGCLSGCGYLLTGGSPADNAALVKELAQDKNAACLHVGATAYTPEVIVARSGETQLAVECGKDKVGPQQAPLSGLPPGTTVTTPAQTQVVPAAIDAGALATKAAAEVIQQLRASGVIPATPAATAPVKTP